MPHGIMSNSMFDYDLFAFIICTNPIERVVI